MRAKHIVHTNSKLFQIDIEEFLNPRYVKKIHEMKYAMTESNSELTYSVLIVYE